MIIRSQVRMPYPFTFEAVVSKPRSTTRRKITDIGFVEGHVTEVSFSDAPVVLTYSEEGRGYVPRAVRHFDGAFYVPLASAAAGFPLPHETGHVCKTSLPLSGRKAGNGEALFRPHLERSERGFTEDERQALIGVLATGEHHPDYSRGQIVEVLSSNEEKAVKAARRFIDDLLVVKRDVWLKVDEPRFVVNRVPDSRARLAKIYLGPTGTGGLTVRPGHMQIGPPSRTRSVSLLDMDRFHDVAATMGAEAQRFGEFAIHDPSVFTTDWALVEAELLVDHALAAYASEMGTQSLRTVTAWAGLRDSLSEYRSTGSEEFLSDALGTHLSDIVGSFEGTITPRMQEIIDSIPLLHPSDRLHDGPDNGMSGEARP